MLQTYGMLITQNLFSISKHIIKTRNKNVIYPLIHRPNK